MGERTCLLCTIFYQQKANKDNENNGKLCKKFLLTFEWPCQNEQEQFFIQFVCKIAVVPYSAGGGVAGNYVPKVQLSTV